MTQEFVFEYLGYRGDYGGCCATHLRAMKDSDHRKISWREGKISFEELQNIRYTTLKGGWDQVFSRWVRAKKYCTGSEVSEFLGLMARSNLAPGGWWGGRSEGGYSFRCGVHWDSTYAMWIENEKVCAICGGTTPRTLCRAHEKEAWRKNLTEDELIWKKLRFKTNKYNREIDNGTFRARDQRTTRFAEEGI